MRKTIYLIVFMFFVSACAQKNIKTAYNSPSKRENLRLFAYAPPVIPHEIYEDACIDCHADNETDAPMIPHSEGTNCRQCHIFQHDVPLFRENSFVRSNLSLKPSNTVPPTIPHRVFMREKCLACHGENSRQDVLNTKHPERINCRQCHIKRRDE